VLIRFDSLFSAFALLTGQFIASSDMPTNFVVTAQPILNCIDRLATLARPSGRRM